MRFLGQKEDGSEVSADLTGLPTWPLTPFHSRQRGGGLPGPPRPRQQPVPSIQTLQSSLNSGRFVPTTVYCVYHLYTVNRPFPRGLAASGSGGPWRGDFAVGVISRAGETLRVSKMPPAGASPGCVTRPACGGGVFTSERYPLGGHHVCRGF